MKVGTLVRVFIVGHDIGEGRVVGVKDGGAIDPILVAFPPCDCGEADCPYAEDEEVVDFATSEVFPL